MAPFRILSLDGGGTWALLQVMALQALYNPTARGHDILADFDLVAATSGGSITLGGLIENMTLADLLRTCFLDQTKREAIFSKIPFSEEIADLVYSVLKLTPRYQTPPKLNAFRDCLKETGDSPLSALPRRVVQSVKRSPHFLITAFDCNRKRATFFRSNLKSLAASGGPHVDPTLAEAIHASSTAPVRYFDRPAMIQGGNYWDGAIGGFNNPVFAALIEALANGVAPGDIAILSIGTGSVRLPLKLPGTLGDAKLLQAPVTGADIPANLGELAGAILDDPPDTASFDAYVVLGQPLPDPNRPATQPDCRLVRLNPVVQPQFVQGEWVPPTNMAIDDFSKIAQLEMDATAADDVKRIQDLGQRWMAGAIPNQAIRSDPQTFHCEIGYATFADAKSAWDRLKAAAQV